MTIDEIKEKIKKLESANFILNMKDMWSASDYATDREQNIAIKKYKKMLEEMEREV